MEINAGFIEKLLETLQYQCGADSEQILESAKILVDFIRKKGIQVYAIPGLSDDLRCFFKGSFAVELPSGIRAIVIDKRAIQTVTEHANVTYSQSLEAVLKHELAHLCGSGDSEIDAWASVDPSLSLPKEAIDRIRNFICRGLFYQDSKPEPAPWIQRFDDLKAHVGYQAAWTATAHYRQKLQAHVLLDQLRLAGWGFDAAFETTHGDLARGLWHRCIECRDFSLISSCNG